MCALILHEMKGLKPHYRLKLLYVMSAILRQSKSRRGERDKYGGCPPPAPPRAASSRLLLLLLQAACCW